MPSISGRGVVLHATTMANGTLQDGVDNVGRTVRLGMMCIPGSLGGKIFVTVVADKPLLGLRDKIRSGRDRYQCIYTELIQRPSPMKELLLLRLSSGGTNFELVNAFPPMNRMKPNMVTPMA